MEEISVRIILNEDRNIDEIVEQVKTEVDTDVNIFFAPYSRDSRQVSASFTVVGDNTELVRKGLDNVINPNDKEVVEVSDEPDKTW